MRKLLFILTMTAMLGIFAGSGLAAVCYCDYGSGDDGTGDGTFGNPYQTVEGCSIGEVLTGGDEIRISEAGAHTTLTGTLTFTNGSPDVTTSSDLTSELATGDYIGKDTANEGWWYVSSLTSDTITLGNQYWGTSEGVTAYKVTADASVALDDLNDAGTSAVSRLKVSGGWNLSTQSQSGKTFIILGAASVFIDMNNVDYVEVSDIVTLGLTTMLSRPGDSNYLHDLIICNSATQSLTQGTAHTIVEDVIIAGTSNSALSIYTSILATYDNIRILSPGNSSSNIGMSVSDSTNGCVFTNFYIYNSYDDSLSITASGANFFSGFTIDKNVYSGSYGITISSQGQHLYDFFIDNTISHGIEILNGPNHFSNITFGDSIGGQDIHPYITSIETHTQLAIFKDYDGTSGDDRVYFRSNKSAPPYPSIIKDTADARSGSCLKFTAVFTPWLISYEIGSAKILSASGDITLKIYLKDNASFDGAVYLWGTKDGQVLIGPTEKTVTTSYVEYSVDAPSASLVVDDYLTLWIGVNGTAGNVFVDDFSYSQ
jgi:hypothetical protein